MKMGAVATDDDDNAEISDISVGDIGGPNTPSIKSNQTTALTWTGPDSKFEKLLTILLAIEEEEEGAKVLIFTYFVGTSKYLTERLSEKGIATLRIAGDVPSDPHRPEHDQRGARIRQFQHDPAIRVLVSTEVGSEGLDFQFCHHVVNYDLPWNPMVVEQRMGRIDRYGQESPWIQIHNLVVNGTVEERILVRLYRRIGIFEKSIGDLEASAKYRCARSSRAFCNRATPASGSGKRTLAFTGCVSPMNCGSTFKRPRAAVRRGSTAPGRAIYW
jgi:ERCC4-related helicase